MTPAQVFLMGACFSLCGCGLFGGVDNPPLEVVPHVDIGRYAGTWYEVSSLPVSQQEGCSCTTAEYQPIDKETIRVINRCRKGGPEGKFAEATGKAFVVPGTNNAKLRVQFFWPFRGDYWVIDLDSAYTYAVVGVPNRKYFWILSRKPAMDEQLLTSLLVRLRDRGFDTSRAQRTLHDCID
jgi:apolipoprotein D and lipocalin family protein